MIHFPLLLVLFLFVLCKTAFCQTIVPAGLGAIVQINRIETQRFYPETFSEPAAKSYSQVVWGDEDWGANTSALSTGQY